jgi:hypothetical protein
LIQFNRCRLQGSELMVKSVNFCALFRSVMKIVDLFGGCGGPLDVAQVCFVPSFVLGRNQGRMNVVRAGNASRRAVKLFKE